MRRYFYFLSLFICPMILFSSAAHAKLRVVASTPDIGSLVKEVGGDAIELEVIAKGTQDAHYLEPKPSYMVKMNRADVLAFNGLSLEEGWLPSLTRGARNPKIILGGSGYLDLGSSIEPLEVPAGGVSRSQGDVHPAGNPHYTLDPVRVASLAPVVAAKLSELDALHKADFENRAKAFQNKMKAKVKEWQARIDKAPSRTIVTYHPSLTYFAKRFGLTVAGFLEPKPGIPPTAGHTLELINLMKRDHVQIMLIENYFDLTAAQRVAKDIPEVKIHSVGISVEAKPELKNLFDVYEELVTAIEGSEHAAKL